MDIKLDELQTFLDVYQAGTFTGASKVLGLSQSALSQKVARLEESLHTALFIRHPRSLSLTASGEKLLVFAKELSQRQESFLSEFNQYQNDLSGVVRIAGFSSIMRSIIIPKLTTFLRNNPKVNIEFSTYEMYELPQLLKQNKADFIITDYFLDRPQIEQAQIGLEEYVIIESKKYKNIPNIFIDHDQYDNATETYFKFIKKKIDYQRIFLGDVYSIIDGVAAGLGKAVMSKHLIEDDRRFTIYTGKKRYIRPIALSYINQAYYSPIMKNIIEILTS